MSSTTFALALGITGFAGVLFGAVLALVVFTKAANNSGPKF